MTKDSDKIQQEMLEKVIKKITRCLAQLCFFPADRGQSKTFTEECLKNRAVSSS